MRLIRNLAFEQYKNFRILLRNISSLLLLVIGPLVLILLVGYAYSGQNLHDVSIGVVSQNYSLLQPAFENFSAYANIIKYNTTAGCIYDLRLSKTRACLEFSSDFGQVPANGSGFVSGQITFYYDNSEEPISDKVVNALSDYFGVEAQQISLESAKSVFSDIQDLVQYIESKNQDLNMLVNESVGINDSLVERHTKLLEIRGEFLPVYDNIKTVQSDIGNVSAKVDTSYAKYNDSRWRLDSELIQVRSQLVAIQGIVPSSGFYMYHSPVDYMLTDNLSFLLDNNLTYYNLSSLNYSANLDGGYLNVSGLNVSAGQSAPMLVNISGLDRLTLMGLASGQGVRAIDDLREGLANFTGSADEYYNYLNYQKKQLDAAVSLLDDVNQELNDDIASTEDYISKIGVAVTNVEVTQGELNSTVKLFSRFNPSAAEALITPFLKNYAPILPGIDNITQAYPGMIAIIVIFISILFANIVTLTEINSKAFYRNLLAPVNSLVFVFGLVMSIITIVFFQIFVLLLVGQFSFGIGVFAVFWEIAAVVTLLSLIFIALGMIIAILIRSEQSSVLTTTFVALGFFLFSDSVTPIEIMPKLAGFFASRNPYVVATLAFKKLIIFGLPLSLASNELALLGSYLIVVLIVLVLVSWRKLKNRA